MKNIHILRRFLQAYESYKQLQTKSPLLYRVIDFRSWCYGYIDHDMSPKYYNRHIDDFLEYIKQNNIVPPKGT
jgi:hypothetical protein